MIFICVGSRDYQFDRLLKEIDNLIEQNLITDEVIAQIGSSNYIPKHYKFERFLSREKFLDFQKDADIIISHGGTGALVNSLKLSKKLIAVPRLSKYGEAIDDHQTQVTSILEEQNYLISVTDISELGQAIEKIKHSQLKTFRPYSNIINLIEKFIQEN